MLVVGRDVERLAAAGRAINRWASTPAAVDAEPEAGAAEMDAIRRAIATCDSTALWPYGDINGALRRMAVLSTAVSGLRLAVLARSRPSRGPGCRGRFDRVAVRGRVQRDVDRQADGRLPYTGPSHAPSGPRAAPLHSLSRQEKACATATSRRARCATSSCQSGPAPAGSTHICIRCGKCLPDVPQIGTLVWGTCYKPRCVPDSAARRPGGRRVVTTEGLNDGAALDGPSGSGPARGFPVERLQDARGRRVPTSTDSTAQRQPPLAAGGRRRLGRSAQMRRRAPRTLPCLGGRRDRAMAQLSTVREVGILRSASRRSVHEMFDRGVFPEAPIRHDCPMAALADRGGRSMGRRGPPARFGECRWLLRLPETGSVNHMLAKRECSASAARSPVLQAGRGAAALRGRPPGCEGVTHGRSERRAARP